MTTSSGKVTLDADTFGHNDGGQFYDGAGDPLFQNITSLSFLTSFGNARIDDIVVSVGAVPLPGAALLLLGGLASLAAARRRKAAAV